ncbi:MAG: ISNCY family transposase [Elusimicrobia bacterium]|nr:ISNCY family transposase [Elusimicrobiota bacterium]
MLRLKPDTFDLWDSVLPDELKKLPEELARVDELLQNERFMDPFVQRFNKTMGRPTVPVITFIRLMYLKFRYKLGYETLVQEVSDSLSWRRFCGIGYQQKVPGSTTLIKLTHKYGEDIFKELHNLIIKDLLDRKLVRGRKVRVDTTVISSNIHYPTDSSVLGDGIRRIRQGLRSVADTGLRIGRTLKAVKKLIFSGAQHLRKKGQKSKDRIQRINRTIIRKTRSVIQKVKRIIHRVTDKRTRRFLKETLHVTKQIADQSEQRLAGNKVSERIVSAADPQARPIVKGKLDKPVEFGRTIEIVQDESGYITDQQVHHGNPHDATLLSDMLDRHQEQFPDQLKAIAADTAFGSRENRDTLIANKVKRIGIPWRGKAPPGIRAQQRRPWFKKLRAFRAGIEGTISFLHRRFGLKRSMYRGTSGTAIWATLAIVSANLYRFAHGP